MGSWQATCGISQLPITPGDKTVLIFIHRGTDYYDYMRDEEENTSSMPDCSISGFTYPHDMYVPFAWPVYGTYDDCGELENMKFIQRDFLAEVLRLRGIDNELTKEWFFKLERGRLKFRGYLGPDRLGQLLIRKDVWSKFLTLKPRTWRGQLSLKRVTRTARAYVDRTFDNKDASRLSYLENILEEDEEFCHEGSLLKEIAGFTLSQLRWKWLDKTISKEASYEIVDELAKVAHIHDVFSNLRMSWGPQAGCGDQDQDFTIHARAAQIVVDVAKAAHKKQMEDR